MPFNRKSELHIVKAICERYNGKEKTIWFPAFPRELLMPGVGLKALNAVKKLVELKIYSFLLLVDREHFRGGFLDEVENYLRSKGIVINGKPEKISEDALKIDCSIGAHKAVIYVVVSGSRKSIEENIALLIELEFSEDVKPEKNEIKRFLRKHNIRNLEELVSNSKMENIVRAFPGLSLSFKFIVAN
jgi:hypothetical protein